MPITSDLQGYVRFTWQLLNGFRLSGERVIAAERDQDIAPYFDSHLPLRVLDLANGRLRPQFTLLQAGGYRTYGIDLANRAGSPFIDAAYDFARWLYTRKIGGNVSERSGQLVCGDVITLPFAEASFDLVTSVAAFEHFLNVPQVICELHRVLCTGGMVWARIHLFTSPSGGHNLGFTEIPLRSIPAGIDPWDHLRKRRLPFYVPLNEWRLDQYVKEFARHFEIVKQYCATCEGENFLTPQLEAELSVYSRNELTCSAYVIVARKLP